MLELILKLMALFIAIQFHFVHDIQFGDSKFLFLFK